MLVAAGCSDSTPTEMSPSARTVDVDNSKDRQAMPTRTINGQVAIDNLPPHFGLSVRLAFFPVAGPDAEAPFDGDPPAEAVTDCPELYNEVDLDHELHETSRSIPFSISHPSGHYYIQLRTLLYRKQDGKVFAQAEQFFFGRRPMALLDDIPSVTLPVEWPSIPLDELGHYGTVEPNTGR